MLEEQGRVVAIESDALWVETIQTSTCGACRARSGCGQRVLAGVLGSASTLRVSMGGRAPQDFRLDQQVTIGIPDHVVVAGSLAVYLLPLLAMLVCAGAATRAGAGEPGAVLAALLGLLAGGALVRFFSWRARSNPGLQPLLLDGETPRAASVFQ